MPAWMRGLVPRCSVLPCPLPQGCVPQLAVPRGRGREGKVCWIPHPSPPLPSCQKQRKKKKMTTTLAGGRGKKNEKDGSSAKRQHRTSHSLVFHCSFFGGPNTLQFPSKFFLQGFKLGTKGQWAGRRTGGVVGGEWCAKASPPEPSPCLTSGDPPPTPPPLPWSRQRSAPVPWHCRACS